MDLKLKREKHQEDGIFGILVDKRGKVLAYTLEHSYDLKPKLPNGTFKCVRGMHCLKGGKPFETFEITGVEGHTGILFHTGNWNKDSSGCVLLGDAIRESRQGEMITNSKVTFADFMDLQKNVNEFTLIVED